MIEMLEQLFSGVGTAQTLLFVSLTAFLGVLMGKASIGGVKLGIAGVLFAGLFLAHIGATIDHDVLHFIREFGLILFIYAIGIDVGPRFFSSFRNDGLKLNLLAAMVVVMGFGIALFIHYRWNIDSAVITGIMSGAVTNTPGLGAAQQTLTDMGRDNAATVSGMGYAVAYPFGIIGLILTMLLIKVLFRIKLKNEYEDYNTAIHANIKNLESVEVAITNPNIFGKNLAFLKKLVNRELVFSRVKRNNESLVATEDVILQEGDIICGVSSPDFFTLIETKIGKITITNKREISGKLAMFNVLVTNRKVAGKTIEQIGIYRRYEANITRIFRAGIEILPTLDTTVELGDTVRIVGKRDLLPEVKNELGNSVNELAHPNTIPIFLGIFLGIIVGSIPIFIPGLSAPAKLGMAGGPLLVAILFGYKGRIKKFDFYMTPGANQMMKELGIIMFLACVGLSSGAHFVETLREGGFQWILFGVAITFIPVIVVGVIARFMKLNYLKICGFISGAMTDPPALEFANSLAPSHAQSTSYATVYPLTMFLRIIMAQALILLTI
ncbi:MAG: putative transporter [Bacteroidales bacterium]|nr:putative transporter [Bacteroidales bacterium]